MVKEGVLLLGEGVEPSADQEYRCTAHLCPVDRAVARLARLSRGEAQRGCELTNGPTIEMAPARLSYSASIA